MALPAGAAAAAPNILFIMTDDQRLEGTMAVMPKTTGWFNTGRTLETSESFAGGTFFPNGMANTPLCCPARASTFSGRYVHNHGLDRNPEVFDDPKLANFDQNATIQRYLSDAGYRTGLFGKFLNSWDLTQDPSHWDDWAVTNKASTPVVVNERGTPKWVWKYSANYLADRATQFLEESDQADPAQPWYMHLAIHTPHGPFEPEAKYASDPVPAVDEGPSFFEPDRLDKPLWVRGGNTDEDAVKEDWTLHLRMLKTADDVVDRVMRKVAELGDEQDTLAVFVSDNGFHWGEHGRRAKPSPYLENTNIPFYLRWPAAPGQIGQPGTDNRFAALVDLAPTAIDAVNDASGGPPIVPSPGMDGIPLTDPAQPTRNRAFTEGPGIGPPIDINGVPTPGFCNNIFPSWAALRTLTFHYVEYYQTYWAESATTGGCATLDSNGDPRDFTTNYSNVTFREYYDLTADPKELTNLLGDANPDNDPPTGSLHAQLEQDRQCQGQGCPPQGGDPPSLPVEVGIVRRPDASTSATSATFTFASTDPTATFACKQGSPAIIGALPFTACTSPATYSSLDGLQEFQVRASTASSTDTETYQWDVGSGYPPDTTLTIKPPDPSLTQSATFEFQGTGPFLQCRAALASDIASASWSPCSSPHGYTAPADGRYTFEVRATDALAGPDPTPASHTWTIDTLAPDTSLTRTPAAVTHVGGATFSFTVTPIERSAGTECRLDSGEWSVCAVEKTYYGLGTGGHTFSVRARDISGNVDPTPAEYTWTIGSKRTFSNTPDPAWPEISEGTEVRAIVPDGSGGWYVGGDFTKVRDAGGEHDHVDLVHIKSDKTVDTNWRPATTGGAVTSILNHGGAVYVGGSFTAVKGTDDPLSTARNRLASFHPATGEVTGWNPDADNDVNALTLGSARTGPTTTYSIYAAGAFQSVQGVSHAKVVELDPATGAPTSWSPSIPGSATLYAVQATSLVVPDCAGGGCGNLGNVYVGGAVGTDGLVMDVDRATGQINPSWQPDPNGPVYALKVRWGLGGLPSILTGGTFDNIGAPTPADRRQAAGINLTDQGSATPWDPSLDLTTSTGDSARDFLPFACEFTDDPGCFTVIAGSFDRLRANTASPMVKNNLAETDALGGSPNDWTASLDDSALVLSCWPSGFCDQQSNRVMAVGGRFTTPRNLLAFYPAPGAGDSTAPDPPTLTDTDPNSPANDNSPEVKGTAEADSTVRLYTSSGCSGSPVATGSAAGFLSPGLTVSVADNSTTTLHATAEDAAGNVSGCSSSSITYVEVTGYVRPKGATPMFLPLVPSYQACTSPNRVHAPTLNYGSCNPPNQETARVQVGTPDANTEAAKSVSKIKFVSILGNPGMPDDEADVAIVTDVNDVYQKVPGADPPDYTGELGVRVPLQITDRSNGSAPLDHGTVTEFVVGFTVPCVATPDTTTGASCVLSTTADALIPGMVKEGVRTIWQLAQVFVTDGGADDLALTDPNAPFMRQGVFVP